MSGRLSYGESSHRLDSGCPFEAARRLASSAVCEPVVDLTLLDPAGRMTWSGNAR